MEKLIQRYRLQEKQLTAERKKMQDIGRRNNAAYLKGKADAYSEVLSDLMNLTYAAAPRPASEPVTVTPDQREAAAGLTT